MTNAPPRRRHPRRRNPHLRPSTPRRRRKKRHAEVTGSRPSAPVAIDYEVQRLAADGNYRGRGTGTRLLRAVEGFVRDEQARVETGGAAAVAIHL